MTHHDFHNLQVIFSDPEAMKYYHSTKNAQKTREWIIWTIENDRKYRIGLWIVEDKATGTFLGQCGIVPQEIDGVTEMGIGYLFARKAWGYGYATEAAQACINHVFTKLNIKKIIAVIDIYNHPSIKVAQRLGMKKEKRTVKWGKWVDVYAVKKSIEAPL